MIIRLISRLKNFLIIIISWIKKIDTIFYSRYLHLPSFISLLYYLSLCRILFDLFKMSLCRIYRDWEDLVQSFAEFSIDFVQSVSRVQFVVSLQSWCRVYDLVNRFLGALDGRFGSTLFALLGWSPLDLRRVELIHQLHGECRDMRPLRV